MWLTPSIIRSNPINFIKLGSSLSILEHLLQLARASCSSHDIYQKQNFREKEGTFISYDSCTMIHNF